VTRTAIPAAAGRVALACLVVVGAAAAWHWRAAFDPKALSELVQRYPAAPLVYLALHIAASLVFVPRTLLAIAAGLLFGMWWGVLWAAIGSVAGAAAGFLVARYVTAGPIEAGRVAPALEQVAEGGWRMVAMIRLVPIVPHSLANYGLALTRLPLGAYCFGSLIGQLPMTVAAAEIGAAGERAMTGGGWIVPTAIGLTALALSSVLPLVVARWRARRAPPAAARP
jgi:uncharacterized membrane protein YdjX (TVP38/TMEM64 family)